MSAFSSFARIALGVLLAVGAASLAGREIARRGFGGPPLVASVASLALLFLPYFLFALSNLGESLGRRLRRHPWTLWVAAAALLFPYLVYVRATGTFSPEALATLAAFVFTPTLLVALAHRTGKALHWLDALGVAAIWLPFDFRWLGAVWLWPDGLASYGFSTILAVDLALVLYVSFRGVDRVGYRWSARPRDGRILIVNFALLAAVAIPLGLAIDFLALSLAAPEPGALAGSFLAIFLFIGLPEELLFRGLIQNFLESALGRGWRSLLLAAVLFGAAHLNNAPAPNGKYFLLASIAGVFYGLAYRQSGGLVVPAIVHALVDTIWRHFFRG